MFPNISILFLLNLTPYPTSLDIEVEQFRYTERECYHMSALAEAHYDFYSKIFLQQGVGQIPFDWGRDSNWCKKCWYSLRISKNVEYNKEFRAQKIRELKYLLGPIGFNNGSMPTPSPGWLFEGGLEIEGLNIPSRAK